MKHRNVLSLLIAFLILSAMVFVVALPNSALSGGGGGMDGGGGGMDGGHNNPVPEPCTMILLGSGLVGLVSLRRKFKKRKRHD